ncbi:Acylphosphatase [Gracilariopsis chorda]|uniref:acylphosphatase n=1 Tax=Gracilariopsis chorda TaxID=448386 RepID=A0A2V3IJT1_9FLOR|nr:Acylphosphatase [Gracilariopsis chorda]|eukprot:PXF42355.1 Acylphosphatase [Gracilariopsis chorda]
MANAQLSSTHFFAVTLSIKGTVQGVFYRATASTVAKQVGVVGYVRNMRDGSVQLCAEGTMAQLHQLIDWCKQGPPMATVHSVTQTEPIHQISHPTFLDFSVRRT